jgi:hypothetical protein
VSVVLWMSVAWSVWTVSDRPFPSRSKRRGHDAIGYADALDLLALSARRGAPLDEMVARCVRYLPPRQADCLAPVVVAFSRGASAGDAVGMANLDAGSPLALALRSLVEQAHGGGGLEVELRRLAADSRQLESSAVASAARRLSVWLSGPLVVCHLPAFVLIAVVPALLPDFGVL